MIQDIFDEKAKPIKVNKGHIRKIHRPLWAQPGDYLDSMLLKMDQ